MEYRLTGEKGLARLSPDAEYQSDNPSRFRAKLTSVPLGSIIFEDLSATAFSYSAVSGRSEPTADQVRFVTVLSGHAHVDHPAGSFRIEQDEVAFMTGEATSLWTEAATRIATVIMHRSSMRIRKDDLAEIQTAVLGSPLTPVWLAFMRTIAVSAPDEGLPAADLLTHAVVDIARGIAIVADGRNDLPATEWLRQRAHEIIKADYSDPALGAAQIAATLDLSERQLHRLFLDEELTVGRRIRATRVEAASCYLIHGEDSFKDIALRVGFGSSDAAYRAFREVETLTPAQFRKRGPKR